MEVAKSDRVTFKWGTAAIIGLGFNMMIFGFVVWHRKIQPMQDEVTDLQIRKLRRELALLEQGPR